MSGDVGPVGRVIRSHPSGFCPRLGLCGSSFERDTRCLTACVCQARLDIQRGEALVPVGENQDGLRLLSRRSYACEVHRPDGLARAHSVAGAHIEMERTAFELHRVDPQVQENLQPRVHLEGDGMLGFGDHDDFGVGRRKHFANQRFDSKTLAHHLRGENGIGNIGQFDHFASER